MATKALDIVTILHALSEFNNESKTKGWNAKNEKQRQIFTWYEEHRDLLAKFSGLEAKASRFWEELNAYLTERRFDPMVKPFDPALGIGVVSVLDKLVHWLNGPGEIVKIPTRQGPLPGFELPPNGVNIYEVNGYPGSHLLELLTQSEDTLWLFVHKNIELDGLDMIKLSMDVMSSSRKTPMIRGFSSRAELPTYVGAQVLMVNFDLKPDISWLLEAETMTEDGAHYVITQAAQQFKMRMDETGARVRVATVVAGVRSLSQEPIVYVLNQPFYGWWTQKGIDLPIAVFFADWDSLHRPSGSLEDL
jgi:hypothetical protein